MKSEPHSQAETLLQHYVRLAQEPGWRQYVRDRLETMAREPMYADFPELVRQELARLQKAPENTPNSNSAP